MKKSLLFVGVLSLACFISSGCSYLPQRYQVVRNNSNDYLQAQTTPPLKIPPGYNSDRFQDHYVVPNPQLANHSKAPNIYPPNVMNDKTLI